MSEFLYNHVRDYDHIIWDWNGTLLADLFIVVTDVFVNVYVAEYISTLENA